MSRQDPSHPNKGKTQAKYIIRVPSTIPFASASTPPEVGSSRPPPPSTTPTPSVGPTPSVVGPTLVPPMEPTPYIHPSSSISTPSSIPSPDVHQSFGDLADPTDLGDPTPHDRLFIEPSGKGFLPSRVATQVITRSIKQQFLQPCASWGVIPTATKNCSRRDLRRDADDEMIRTQCWVEVVGGIRNDDCMRTLIPQQGQSAPS
ncbi:hypothetical protein LR48_Vigan09g098900 [Vigna angularis]|uniref:Uncharacterized protein n=1 Tax=Phaseolus angularis TaxID=3914 RepID=A0A0L9VB93_PHAAN|nr:hypothetical protein LR48_Vigan09g098900 [Vigna angularis]